MNADNQNESEQLDQVLQAWAARHAPQEETIERLRRQISQSLAADLPTSDAAAPIATRSRMWWPRVRLPGAAWFALGAAASLLIALSYMWLAGPQPQPVADPGTPESLPPSFAWLQQDQLENKSRLLSELERLFDNRLQWVAETSSGVKMGLQEDDVPPAENAAPVVVRVVVVRKQAGDASGMPVWAIDVVSRSEQVMRLTGDIADGAQLSLWAYALPDGTIEVDTDFQWDGPIPVRANSSRLQHSGVPVKVHSAREGDVEYEVFQTVSLLDSEVH
jgi:hypothetical protein